MESRLEKISTAMTNWVGTPASLVVHTIIFIASFAAVYFGVPLDDVLLILTTAVSLEAIYLAIFIQMTVNRHTEHLEEVGADIEDIQEEVEDLGEDMQEISEDVEDISEDVEDISEDIEKIQGGDDTGENNATGLEDTLRGIQVALHALAREVADIKTATTGVPTAPSVEVQVGEPDRKESTYLDRIIGLIPFRAKQDNGNPDSKLPS